MKALYIEKDESTLLISVLKILNVITMLILIAYLIRETIDNNTRELNNCTMDATCAGYSNVHTNHSDLVWKNFSFYPNKTYLKRAGTSHDTTLMTSRCFTGHSGGQPASIDDGYLSDLSYDYENTNQANNHEQYDLRYDNSDDDNEYMNSIYHDPNYEDIFTET
ncbi:hypothetical protein RF11_15469 [Thelohanellus kitauei]|uniref:Uncharacterized protein n=1 Tax=Thelohanellus kitauei TaxID=669202 RepID=A0A0C2M798_THEKT|nr:hypothetical protein RF11_15469 [Thelohanellus kitauei]